MPGDWAYIPRMKFWESVKFFEKTEKIYPETTFKSLRGMDMGTNRIVITPRDYEDRVEEIQGVNTEYFRASGNHHILDRYVRQVYDTAGEDVAISVEDKSEPIVVENYTLSSIEQEE